MMVKYLLHLKIERLHLQLNFKNKNFLQVFIFFNLCLRKVDYTEGVKNKRGSGEYRYIKCFMNTTITYYNNDNRFYLDINIMY